jgi:hypothetical protein
MRYYSLDQLAVLFLLLLPNQVIRAQSAPDKVPIEGAAPAGLGDREARKAYDRGCVLAALGRYQEALPLLEKSAGQMSSPVPTCKTAADLRNLLKEAQDKLQACPEEIRGTAGKLPSGRRREICVGTYGYGLGDYSGASAAQTAAINDSESQQQNAEAAGVGDAATMLRRSTYQQRALSLFALGNSLGALRDLQTSMELWKRHPDILEYENYFYRAVVFSDMGNTQSAMDDCKIVLTFRIAGFFAQNYCTNLIAAGQAGATGTAGVTVPSRNNGTNTPSTNNIDAEIAKVLSQGQYSALPARQISQSGTPGITTLAVTNGTQYSLRILASGPTPGDYTIMPGATQDIAVAPGSYKIVGTVPASNVLPFYGTESYASGTRYVYRFYIQ